MSNFYYKNNIKLMFQCLSIAALIIVGLRIPQVNYFALLAAVGYIFTSNQENIWCILAFLVSFSPIFKIALGGFTFFNVAIIVSVLRGLMLCQFKLRKRGTILFVFLACYMILNDFGNDFIGVLTVLSYLFLVLVLYIPGSVSMHKLVTFTTWGVIITSMVAQYQHLFPRLSAIMSLATVRLGVGIHYSRFSGIENNPNYYTVLLSVCIAAFLVMIVEGRNKKIDLVYVGLMIFFGLMTASQSFIVTTLLCILGVFLTLHGSGNRKVPLTIMAFFVVAVIAFTFLRQDVVQALVVRLQSTVESDSLAEITSGRTDLAKYYVDYLINNVPILFIGRGIAAGILPNGASHNYYIDILYHLGLIGGTLYLLYLCTVFLGHVQIGKIRKAYCYMPLFCFLIRAFAINLIARENFIFALLICSTALYDKSDE